MRSRRCPAQLVYSRAHCKRQKCQDTGKWGPATVRKAGFEYTSLKIRIQVSRQENYVEDLHNNLKAYAKDESMKGNRQQTLAVVFEDRLWIETF